MMVRLIIVVCHTFVPCTCDGAFNNSSMPYTRAFNNNNTRSVKAHQSLSRKYIVLYIIREEAFPNLLEYIAIYNIGYVTLAVA